MNNSVLEGKQSLISRTNWTIYAPFVADGKHVRKLVPEGYVGRKNKPHAFPPYYFPFQTSDEDTSYNIFLRAFYDVFHRFTKNILTTILAHEYRVGKDADQSDIRARRDWELIALWADCIREWCPGFIGRKSLAMKPKNQVVRPNLDILVETIARIIWNVTVAHASDHVGFADNGPQGNIFRLYIKPPLGDIEVPEDFEDKLVKRFDLFKSYLTTQLFYKPLNLVRLLDVTYDFDSLNADEERRAILHKHFAAFREDLNICDIQQTKRDPDLCRLEDVSSSIQY